MPRTPNILHFEQQKKGELPQETQQTPQLDQCPNNTHYLKACLQTPYQFQTYIYIKTHTRSPPIALSLACTSRLLQHTKRESRSKGTFRQANQTYRTKQTLTMLILLHRKYFNVLKKISWFPVQGWKKSKRCPLHQASPQYHHISSRLNHNPYNQYWTQATSLKNNIDRSYITKNLWDPDPLVQTTHYAPPTQLFTNIQQQKENKLPQKIQRPP